MSEWKAPDPAFRERVMARVRTNHFNSFIGFSILTMEPGEVEAELVLEQHHLQQMGFVHGGVTTTMADIVTGFAAYTLTTEKQGVVTVDLKIAFLNPGIGTRLYAKGVVIKAGQKLHFCEAEIWCEGESGRTMIAKASTTMAILNPEDMKRDQPTS
jgi:uncharacterized protein (TIGR00369 family)